MARPRLLTIVLVVVAAIFLVVGIIYLTTQCQHIPSPLPGREAGSTRHRVGFAIVAWIIAAGALLGTFYSARPRPASN